MESASLPWEKKSSPVLSRTILRPSPALARKASRSKVGWIGWDTRASSSRLRYYGLAIGYSVCEGGNLWFAVGLQCPQRVPCKPHHLGFAVFRAGSTL